MDYMTTKEATVNWSITDRMALIIAPQAALMELQKWGIPG